MIFPSTKLSLIRYDLSMEIWPWLKWRIRNHDEQSLLISRLWSSSILDWPEESHFREQLHRSSQNLNWQDLKLRAGEPRPQNGFHFAKKAWELTASEQEGGTLEIEALHSLSRFFWLFDAEFGKTKANPALPILQWIRQPADLTSFQFEAYNISERLANWGLWLGSHASQISIEDRQEIQLSVKTQCQILVARLEKKGLVGNHLFNNFRGLSWGAYLLQDSELLDLLVQPSISSLQRILDSDGSLKEDSTHYHRLTAKNFAEIFFLQQTLNRKFKSENEQKWKVVLEQMFGAAQSMGSWKHLIGDVSPDAPPEDLLDFSSSPWASFFPEEFLSQFETQTKQPMNRFRKIENRNWELVTHINPDCCPQLPGHGHLDTFSFSLFAANDDFVVDPGRSSYEESHWCDTALHSGMSIEDISDFHRKSFMGSKYLKQKGSTTFAKAEEDQICIEREVKDRFKIRRLFTLRDNDLIVKDSVHCESDLSYTLKRNFILSPEQVKNVIWPKNEILPVATNIFGSRRYGHTHPLCSFSLIQSLTGPYQDEVTFRFPAVRAPHASTN
jgi:hypothetical protein